MYLIFIYVCIDIFIHICIGKYIIYLQIRVYIFNYLNLILLRLRKLVLYSVCMEAGLADFGPMYTVW